MTRKAAKTPKDSSANLGFEAKLWLAADKLRNNMDAAEYKHVVLGLIFLKYISDPFEEHHAKLAAGKGLNVPAHEHIELLSRLMQQAQECQFASRNSERSIKELIKLFCQQLR